MEIANPNPKQEPYLSVLDEKKPLKVIHRSLPCCSKLGNSQKVHGMNSQKFSFGKPPWQGGCVFENQFRLRLAHGMHLDFQNLINMPNLRQYGEARGGKRPVVKLILGCSFLAY